MRNLHLRGLWLGTGFALMGVVLIVALAPNPQHFIPWHIWDKIQHAGSFIVLAGWFSCVMRPRHHPLTGLALIAFGMLIEVLQGASGYRDFQYSDIVADAVGVAIGLLLAITPLGLTLEWFEQRVLRLPVFSD